MHYRILIILFALAVSATDAPQPPAVLTPTPTPSSPLDRFTDEQKQLLADGEVAFDYVKYDDPEKEGLGHGIAYTVILKPIDACYAVLSDLSKKVEYFPRNVESDILKKEENRIWLKETLDYTLADVEYVLIFSLDPAGHRATFRLDKEYPHDLVDTEGYWTLEQIDEERTLLTYAILKADVGIPVPEFVVKMISSSDLPDIARNIKKRVESDGRWKDDD